MLRQIRQIIQSFQPAANRFVRALCDAKDSGGPSNTYDKNAVRKEEQLTKLLKESIPGITYISVQDISGGCGAMYEINVEAKEFNGLPLVKQHRLVTDCLKGEIAAMHGIRINTTRPPPTAK